MNAIEIRDAIEPAIVARGLFIVEINVSADNDIELAVESEKGEVTLDDCVAVNDLFEQRFDREQEDYSLTVTSAGLDRPFKVLEQFVKAIGTKVEVSLKGGKRFVAELTESFKGISDKLLPGAIPAVDCAVSYGFAPANAVTVGFFCGAIGQFLAIAGLLIFHSPVMIIAGFVPLFFDNASIAVYANHRGGVKAAVILSFCSGIIQVLGGALCASVLQLVAFGGWHGNFDFSTIFLAVSYIVKYLKVPSLKY